MINFSHSLDETTGYYIILRHEPGEPSRVVDRAKTKKLLNQKLDHYKRLAFKESLRVYQGERILPPRPIGTLQVLQYEHAITLARLKKS